MGHSLISYNSFTFIFHTFVRSMRSPIHSVYSPLLGKLLHGFPCAPSAKKYNQTKCFHGKKTGREHTQREKDNGKDKGAVREEELKIYISIKRNQVFRNDINEERFLCIWNHRLQFKTFNHQKFELEKRGRESSLSIEMRKQNKEEVEKKIDDQKKIIPLEIWNEKHIHKTENCVRFSLHRTTEIIHFMDKSYVHISCLLCHWTNKWKNWTEPTTTTKNIYIYNNNTRNSLGCAPKIAWHTSWDRMKIAMRVRVK